MKGDIFNRYQFTRYSQGESFNDIKRMLGYDFDGTSEWIQYWRDYKKRIYVNRRGLYARRY